MAKAEFGIKECSKCEYNVRCQECIYNKTDISKLIADAKADTVRKMRSLIDRRSNMCGKMSNGIVTSRIYHLTEDALDQIEKEMLEGEKL